MLSMTSVYITQQCKSSKSSWRGMLNTTTYLRLIEI